MRVNIFQNNICSIDFDTVDQVIDFIKKFNKDRDTVTSNPSPININPWTGPFETRPQEPWYKYDWTKDVKIGDTIPDPHIVYCAEKNANYTTNTYNITTE